MADSWICESANDVDNYPPMPQYGLWYAPFTWSQTYRNNPQTYTQTIHGVFSTHGNLAQVKGAVTKDVQYFGDHPPNKPGFTVREYRIYERHNGRWVEIYRIPTDTEKRKHELWTKGAAPKQPIAVDEDDIQAAIASITGGQ